MKSFHSFPLHGDHGDDCRPNHRAAVPGPDTNPPRRPATVSPRTGFQCLCLAGLLAVPLLAAGAVAPPATQPAQPRANGARPVDDPPWLRQELERVRAKYKLPSLAASLVIGNRVVAASAVGHRKLGDPTRVTQNDRYDIASCSKPITSTLFGALVEAGVLSFDDTIEAMFPELVGEMQPGYRKATVRMLLAHTAGLPGVPSKAENRQPTHDPQEAMARRYQYVRYALADPPQAKPGAKNIYGSSCVIAVSYVERKLKKPYEELMQQYVFRKLGMTTAGRFTTATLPDQLDGPWPHILEDGHLVAIPPRVDKGISRSPAGGICLSIVDFGRFAASELHGENGHKGLLRSATSRELHRLMLPVHATMSFGRQKVGWAKGEVLWHNGAHVGCAATIHLVPQENYAICTATNCNGREAGNAQGEVQKFLAKRAQTWR